MNEYPEIIIENINKERLVIVDNIDHTIIKKSDIHGYGLFSTNKKERGDLLCILDGQIVTWDSYNSAASSRPFSQFSDYLFMEWNALDQNILMIRPFRTKYSFINHSRKPNLILRRYPIAIIVKRDISPGDELTIDYRKEPLNSQYINDRPFL